MLVISFPLSTSTFVSICYSEVLTSYVCVICITVKSNHGRDCQTIFYWFVALSLQCYNLGTLRMLHDRVSLPLFFLICSQYIARAMAGHIG